MIVNCVNRFTQAFILKGVDSNSTIILFFTVEMCVEFEKRLLRV